VWREHDSEQFVGIDWEPGQGWAASLASGGLPEDAKRGLAQARAERPDALRAER
jgi:hypothetical protein